MVVGEGAIVDHGRYVGVLVVVRSIVVAIGVRYDRKTFNRERSQQTQYYLIAQVKGSSMLHLHWEITWVIIRDIQFTWEKVFATEDWALHHSVSCVPKGKPIPKEVLNSEIGNCSIMEYFKSVLCKSFWEMKNLRAFERWKTWVSHLSCASHFKLQLDFPISHLTQSLKIGSSYPAFSKLTLQGSLFQSAPCLLLWSGVNRM